MPFVFVFTKTDKDPPSRRRRTSPPLPNAFRRGSKLLAVFTCSAATGQGRQELLGVIDGEMMAIDAASIRCGLPKAHPTQACKRAFGKTENGVPTATALGEVVAACACNPCSVPLGRKTVIRKRHQSGYFGCHSICIYIYSSHEATSSCPNRSTAPANRPNPAHGAGQTLRPAPRPQWALL